MSFKLPLTLALALFAAASSHARGREGEPPRQDDRKVIEDFVNTRGAAPERPGEKKPTPKQRPSQTRAGGKRAAASSASKKGKGARPAAGDKATAADASAAQQAPADEGAAIENASAPAAAPVGPKRIGLGYTLFMSDEDSNAFVVDTAREFKAGDQIRIQLETNVDGFLYIFHTEDGRSPQMLFPHAALEQGRNNVAAHSREFFPADPSYGFVFDERPAAERLYVVVSRKALPGVPTGEELLKFCGGEREDCYWKPSAAEWERIRAGGTGARPVEVKNRQAAGTRRAAPATRGVKLKKGEPAPAVVRLNDRPETDVLVTTIDLVHK